MADAARAVHNIKCPIEAQLRNFKTAYKKFGVLSGHHPACWRKSSK